MFEARIAELNRFNEQNPVSYDKRTYTVDEIQDILGISRPTAYNLVKQGVFHSVRVGGHIRISKKSFDDWLDRSAKIVPSLPCCLHRMRNSMRLQVGMKKS